MDVWDTFDIYQNPQTNYKAEMAAVKAESMRDAVQNGIDRVDDRISHLALLCRAMFELLQERTDITNDDLAKKIEEIDLRDGRADGKMSAQIKKCPTCGKTLSPKFNRCLYCGYQDVSSDPFNTVK